MPKFFVDDNQIEGSRISITGEDVNHITNVLRLKKDDYILVCDKQNSITYNSKIEEILKEKVVCKIDNEIAKQVESKVKVHRAWRCGIYTCCFKKMYCKIKWKR